MKNISIRCVIFSCFFFLIACGGGSGGSSTDQSTGSTQITINVESINEASPVDATLTILGADADKVVDAEGNSLTTTDVNTGRTVGRLIATNGVAKLALASEVTPSEDSPVRILVQADLDGYVVNTTSLILTQHGDITSTIKLVDINNPPLGVTADTDSTGTVKNGIVEETITLETPMEDSGGNRIGRVVIRIPAQTQLQVRKEGTLQSAADGAFTATVVYFLSQGQGDLQTQSLTPSGFINDSGSETVGAFDAASVSNLFSFVVKDSESNKVQLFTPPLPIVTNVSPQVVVEDDALEVWLYDEGALTGEWSQEGQANVASEENDDGLLVSFTLAKDIIGGPMKPGANIVKNQNGTIVNTSSTESSASIYELKLVNIAGGTFTMGEPESSYEGAPGTYDAPEHTVVVSDFQMSETEVTNQQYVDFLNAAHADGLVEVSVETANGPDKGFTLVYGSSSANELYRGQAILNLSGTRVMKDHDNDDGDNDPFTGVIEPENPLNISFIGFDDSKASGEKFYVKNPRSTDDFDWQTLTNYYNYTTVTHEEDQSVLLNDYDQWEELADYPNNLPTQDDVKNWPATFIRWYGAKAFALYYDMDLPTEAEWEYAAKAGSNYVYATSNGNVVGDGSSAVWNHLEANPSLGHVLDVKINSANPFGLYNMAGNVWEWIEDWYAKDFYADATDPINTSDSGVKVRRGGAWNYHKATLKSTARFSDEKFKGNDHFGFRVIKR